MSMTVTPGTIDPTTQAFTATGPEAGIGLCLYGTEVGIVDYSRKDRDTFGNITLIPRGYSDLVSFKVCIDTDRANEVRSVLAANRASAARYVGHVDHDATIVTGYLVSFSITLDNWQKSSLTLEVEGVVHG